MGWRGPRPRRHRRDAGMRPETHEEHVMKSPKSIIVATAAALISVIGAASSQAQESSGTGVDVSILGGVHAFNKNDTAIPDHLLSVPAVANAAYRLTPNLALEGDFTWLIPMKQSVDLGSGAKQDR